VLTDLASYSLVTLSAVFFVVDPLAAVPLFLAMTRGDSPEQRRSMAARASIACFVTLTAFAAAGGLIFQVFGITLGAFKIAGGLLLFLLAVDMMRAQPSRVRSTPEEQQEAEEKQDVAIIPLAIPMLSGPGAIATVMVLVSQARSRIYAVPVFVAIVITSVATYFILRAATLAERTLRRTGLNILTRVMGLILAAVAVQFVVNGLADVAPMIFHTIAKS
jgi:multiple antibiotic resistance protein